MGSGRAEAKCLHRDGKWDLAPAWIFGFSLALAIVTDDQDQESGSLGGGENWIHVHTLTLALTHTHTPLSQTLPLFSECRWQHSRACYGSREALAAGCQLLVTSQIWTDFAMQP